MWYVYSTEYYLATKEKKEQNLATCWVWLVTSLVPVLERTWAKLKSRPVWATGDTVELINLLFMAMWMSLEDIMLSEMSQKLRDKYYMFPLVYGR